MMRNTRSPFPKRKASRTLGSELYEAQVDLLLEVLPFVAKHRRYAVKGGTAINLFHLDMPRLSVDIDLCYLPISDRDESFRDMHRILAEIKSDIENSLGIYVRPTKPLDGKSEAGLLVHKENVGVKIEPNYIIRGCLFEPEEKEVATSAQTKFNKTASALILNQNDLYGGKFCAALDRQHPRDLFDVHNYFKNHQIDEDAKDSFLFYLLSHNRPVHELLDPRDLPIKKSFETEFQGMTTEEVSLDELLTARTMLKEKMLAAFDVSDRKLLLSFANNTPDWSMYRHPKIKEFPSVRWKLFNIDKIDKQKRNEQLQLLENVLVR